MYVLGPLSHDLIEGAGNDRRRGEPSRNPAECVTLKPRASRRKPISGCCFRRLQLDSRFRGDDSPGRRENPPSLPHACGESLTGLLASRSSPAAYCTSWLQTERQRRRRTKERFRMDPTGLESEEFKFRRI